MDKHIIFSDVDGTVYGHDHKIHPQTIKDIKKAQALGIEFALCTGNPSLDGKNMHKVAQKLGARYIVGSNGASLFDMESSKYIYTETIPKEKAQKFLDFSIKKEASAIWWDERTLYGTPHCSEAMENMVKEYIFGDGSNLSHRSKIPKDILKFEFMEKPELVDEAEKYLKSAGFLVARISEKSLEITQANISKGHGVHKLCELLDVKVENTMGIGDSANDLGMFKEVGYSYAMGNATNEVKAKASYQTASVRDNGLGEAIIDFINRIGLKK